MRPIEARIKRRRARVFSKKEKLFSVNQELKVKTKNSGIKTNDHGRIGSARILLMSVLGIHPEGEPTTSGLCFCSF
jgi:hypothetical protein